MKLNFEAHSFIKRWTHWFNVPLLSLMIWSGILIYWANDIYIVIPDSVARALNINQRLAEGMAWHFFIMWGFVLNGLVYLTHLTISGSWRSLIPGNAHSKYNTIQRMAYLSVIIMAIWAVLSGLAIYKPVTLGWLTKLLGGYEAARFQHFLMMCGFVLFIPIHIIQVIRAGWNNFRSMAAGSLVVLALFFIIVIIGVQFIKSGEKIERSPKILRKTLVLNERVWSNLFSFKNVSLVRPSPPKGKLPRINGRIGLETAPDLKTYKIIIQSPEKTITLPFSSVYATPKIGYSTEFRCIEGWSEDMQFAGARFSDFIAFYKLGKKADGSYYQYVGLETPDRKYYVSIDMESMLHSQTLLSYEMNHEELRVLNGAPLRLAIPIKYGYKSLKRVGKIIFSDTRLPDYWVEYGYDWYAGL